MSKEECKGILVELVYIQPQAAMPSLFNNPHNHCTDPVLSEMDVYYAYYYYVTIHCKKFSKDILVH